jgi:crotonobetainyl-CoA:carnitine CoA-transferase CaiB-like acyl-CoA transferase
LVVELEHPTLGAARSIANPIRLNDQPLQYRFPPPLLGEHTQVILRQLQYSEEHIQRATQEACAVR